MTLHVYLSEENNNGECITCIVVAKTEEQARDIYLDSEYPENTLDKHQIRDWYKRGWATPRDYHQVSIANLGVADQSLQAGVIRRFSQLNQI